MANNLLYGSCTNTIKIAKIIILLQILILQTSTHGFALAGSGINNDRKALLPVTKSSSNIHLRYTTRRQRGLPIVQLSSTLKPISTAPSSKSEDDDNDNDKESYTLKHDLLVSKYQEMVLKRHHHSSNHTETIATAFGDKTLETSTNLPTKQTPLATVEDSSKASHSLSTTAKMPETAQAIRGGDRNKDVSIFKKIRNTIFPIHGKSEVTNFLLIGSIKFFIILALTLTRDLKDTLVVTSIGAEAIAFLKIYGVLPAATLFIGLYSKMSNVLSKSTLFYVTCVPFFVYFALFDLIIYPNRALLHPSIETVSSVLKMSSSNIIAKIISNWTSSLYYVIAEIYSSVSVGLLFWQYANDVVSVDQAKRFYPLFSQMSGLAPVVAGQFVVRFATSTAGNNNFQTSLHRITGAITFAGIMINFFYTASRSFISRQQQQQAASKQQQKQVEKKEKKKKPKLSMMESMKFLSSQQYLRLIASVVISYGLSINFTEIIWKSLVKKLYTSPVDYQRFMSNFSSVVGLSTSITIFFGVHVIRLLGWKIGAIATPALMSVLSIPFFITCVLLRNGGAAAGLIGLDSQSLLKIGVIFGTILSLVSKTSKYALFDPTTQMTYIPLDDESKVKGKAAIDVLGSRIGKSGGSFIQQLLIMGFGGSIIQASPVVSVIYYTVLFGWMSSVSKLSILFNKKTNNKGNDEDDKDQKKRK